MDLFLQINKLTGPVSAKNRAGWFKVTSFTWSMAIPAPAAGTATTGKRESGPFTVTRPVDFGSRPAMESMTKNVPIGGTGALTTFGGDTVVGGVATPTVTYTLTNAQAQTIRYSAVRGGADDVTEEVALRFTSLSVKHDPSATNYKAV